MNAKPDATTQNLLCPRNVSQVRNAKQRFKKKYSGTDYLTNLIQLSLQYEDIRFLNVAPDLIMVNISPFMLEQARAILKIDYDTARQKQQVGYDTQFKLGDYYVSWVTIRDIRFRNRVSGNSPILGVAQVIHERKIQMHHELAWQIITNLIPEFGTAKLVATSGDRWR